MWPWGSPLLKKYDQKLRAPRLFPLTPSFPGTFIALCGGRAASSSQFHLQILQFVEMREAIYPWCVSGLSTSKEPSANPSGLKVLSLKKKSFSGDDAVSSDVTDLVVFGLSVRE